MRFDDRLATALGQPADSPAARQAVWRQIVDLLGQSIPAADELRGEALARLRDWRSEVPPSSRQIAAVTLARQAVPPDLVELFAEDSAAVAAPLLACVQLPEVEWTRLIPRLSPIARALLRHRRDLPQGARHILEAFGPVDLVISAPPAADAQPETGIGSGLQQQSSTPETGKVLTFDFETEAGGIIHWCDLPCRGALLGMSIAEPAPVGRPGVDGQAAGAFRQRTPFKNARLHVEQGEAAGAWTISGVPFFDPSSGRFIGYRASARRPQTGERVDQPGLLGLNFSGDSLRQLIHELRTPLNAINGFAEMIDRQMLGPASAAYRTRAAAILDEGRRLQLILEELEEAAQAEVTGARRQVEQLDCGLLLARVTSVLAPAAADRAVLIALSIAPQCAPALIDTASAERLTTRLLTACVGVSGRGERLDVGLAPGAGLRTETIISVTRPKSLAGLSEDALLDACDVDAEGGPPLGLGFSLRLIRQLAESCGGRLKLGDPAFTLMLPAIQSRPGDPLPEQEAATDWAEWLRRNSPACQEPSASAIAADPAGPVAQR